MLDKATFIEYIKLKRACYKAEREAERFGIEMGSFLEPWEATITLLMNELGGTEYQLEIIDWWLYDVPHGIEGDPKDDTPRIYVLDQPVNTRTVEELYDFLVSY